MDPFEFLSRDHRKIVALFQELDQAGAEESCREEFLKKLILELSLHDQVEEKFLYPALKEADALKEKASIALEEHDVVKILLTELAAVPLDSEDWTAKLAVLKETMQHHMREEERVLFPQARRELAMERLERLGSDLTRERARFLDPE